MSQILVTPGDPNFSFDRSDIMGKGGFGTVYSGKYNGVDVAVKRIDLSRINKKSREDVLLNLHHENVVKLFCIKDSQDFRYYALERCEANLEEYCLGVYAGPIPSEVEVLYQLTKGLEYIHSKCCIHRDIKPQNILISKPDPIVKMKWADFGLSKAVNENGSCSLSGICGTQNWIAPEVLCLREGRKSRITTQSDVYSTGLVFYYFVTRGLHPFVDYSSTTIKPNVQSDDIDQLKCTDTKLAEDHFAKALITNMIAQEAKDRITLEEIIRVLETYPTNQSVPGATAKLPASSGPFPLPSPVRLPKKRTVRKEPKENIMSIADVRSKDIKKLRSWAIKARVIGKPCYGKMESLKPGIPARKCFYVTLEDESGGIRARACTAKICKNFYPKFQEGKQHMIKKVKVVTLDDMEPILALHAKTEIRLC